MRQGRRELGAAQMGGSWACLLLAGESLWKEPALSLPAIHDLQACFYTVFFNDFSPQSKQLSCQLITLKIVGKDDIWKKVLASLGSAVGRWQPTPCSSLEFYAQNSLAATVHRVAKESSDTTE